MSDQNRFYKALGINKVTTAEIRQLSTKTGIKFENLQYYNDNHILPSGSDLNLICEKMGIHENELKLRMGIFDEELMLAISKRYEQVWDLIKDDVDRKISNIEKKHKLVFSTDLGKLYHGDCLSLLHEMASDTVDLVFADPPFNLNKKYPSNINDSLKREEYLKWSEEWISECVRVLKPGGSFLLWNLPKWNSELSGILNSRLNFRHWIAVDIKYRLPIQGRLYPSHYSLLYYTKGPKPNTFQPDRLPMEICPSCKKDLKDYGGYKNKMNPDGVSLSDVWTDIPPVRHDKYKKRKDANELSLKLLDRVIQMASKEGDLVFDPFGGAGTTYIAAQMKNRKWLGIEIGPVDDIIKRFQNIHDDIENMLNIRAKLNRLFLDHDKVERRKRGLWISEDFTKEHPKDEDSLF